MFCDWWSRHELLSQSYTIETYGIGSPYQSHQIHKPTTQVVTCNEMIFPVCPVGCLSLVVCWTCFEMRWTQRLRTALFTVDVSALLSTREETGPHMFTGHVRLHDWILTGHILTYSYLILMLFFCHLSTSDHAEEGFMELLEELLSAVKAHGVVLIPQEEFHLSLSQTVVLRHHWIQPFTQSLKAALASCKRLHFHSCCHLTKG